MKINQINLKIIIFVTFLLWEFYIDVYIFKINLTISLAYLYDLHNNVNFFYRVLRYIWYQVIVPLTNWITIRKYIFIILLQYIYYKCNIKKMYKSLYETTIEVIDSF